MLTNWQRLEKVVAWTGLSVNAFAKGLGLKRAENLYQIKRGNYGISKDLADMIVCKYASVNKSWLLTGEGEMFSDDSQNLAPSIPFFKVEIAQLLQSRSYFSPSGFMSVPMFSDCDFGAVNNSAAMSPELPVGSIVLVRQVPLERIMPGNIYVVMSKLFGGIRFVRREPGSQYLRLVPSNKADFDEVIIEASDVDNIYEVRGYLMVK